VVLETEDHMAGFSYTREERDLILRLAKKAQADYIQAEKDAENQEQIVDALKYQRTLAESIISKIEGAA
jgi:hypothetical protein